MRGRAGGRRDGARFAREGRPNRGRRHSADERAPAEAPRQPGPRLHLKGLRRRPWGDRRRPGVAERALAHTTRTRSDDRRVRPRRERLAAPSRHRSRGFYPGSQPSWVRRWLGCGEARIRNDGFPLARRPDGDARNAGMQGQRVLDALAVHGPSTGDHWSVRGTDDEVLLRLPARLRPGPHASDVSEDAV